LFGEEISAPVQFFFWECRDRSRWHESSVTPFHVYSYETKRLNWDKSLRLSINYQNEDYSRRCEGARKRRATPKEGEAHGTDRGNAR
jgi:hypothetical protein